MRQIEQKMVEAVQKGYNWELANTEVLSCRNGMSDVFLHGNHIARCWDCGLTVDVDKDTLLEWPTRTTMSRLRALGVDVCTRRGDIYLDGEKLA